MDPHYAAADRPYPRRTSRAILARWRWLAYVILLTFVLVLVASTRATRTPVPVMTSRPTANPR